MVNKSNIIKIGIDTTVLHAYLRDGKDPEEGRWAKTIIQKLKEKEFYEVVISQLVLGELLAEFQEDFDNIKPDERNNFFVKVCNLIRDVRAKCPPFDMRKIREFELYNFISEADWIGPSDLIIVCHAAFQGCSKFITNERRLIKNKTLHTLTEQIGKKTGKNMIITEELQGHN